MNNLYKNISKVLENKLASREFGIEPTPAGMGPLFLILTLGPDLVIFASWFDDYTKTLKKFKELYSINSTLWAELDLTLVICVEKKIDEKGELYEKIEQDSYFCRKFVIEFNTSEDKVKEFDTLPFMPLPAKEIVTYRPVLDAKKLLIENGFNTNLARDLTTHHAKDADRIINFLRDDRYGSLTWIPKKIEATNIEVGDFKPEIRLKEIEISNFRAFKGIHKFNLDADLIVLYGLNGLGKTSFFDSIDFLCTGGEATIEDKVGGRETKRIIAALKHLDAEESDSFVRAVINENNNNYIIERKMSDRTNANIQNDTLGRGELLKKLTGFDDQLTKMSIEKFSQLFRASHLFGQDFQSLTAQLNKNSRLDEDILSKMLAFQDYVEALKKIGDINIRLKKDNENNLFQMKQLKTTKKELENEVKESEKLIQSFEEPNIIQEKGKELFGKLSKEKNINIETDNTKFEKQNVLEWRLKVGNRLNEIKNSYDLLKQLQVKFQYFHRSKKEIQEESRAVEDLNILITGINNKLKEKNKILEDFNSELDKKFSEEKRLKKRNFDLEWFFGEKTEYIKINSEIQKEEEKIKEINEKIILVVKGYEKTISENAILKEKEKTLNLQIQNLTKNLNELKKFQDVCSEWQQIDVELKSSDNYLLKCDELLRKTTEKEAMINDEKKKILKAKEELYEETLTAQKSYSDLENALDNIEKFIVDSSCPVCGKNYTSKEELLSLFKSQRGKRPVGLEDKTNQLKDLEEKIQDFNKEDKNLNDLKSYYEEEIKKTKIKKDNFEKRILLFIKRASTLNLPTIINNLITNIQSEKEKINEQIKVGNNEIKSLQAKLKEMEKILTNISGQKASYDEKLRIAEGRKKQFLERKSVIYIEILERKLNLEEKDDVLRNEFLLNKNGIDQLAEQLKSLRNKSSDYEKEIENLNSGLKNNILLRGNKTNKISELKQVLMEVEKLIQELHFDSNVTDNEIQKLEKALNEEAIRLNEIYKKIQNFESIFDAVMLSSNLVKTKKKVKDIKTSIEILEKEQLKNKEYQEKFLAAQVELEATKDKCLRMYIERYGPFASTIQKRLRKPYGFGEIKLRKEKGEFIVEVERKNEKLIPSDYFSASQINIISLSLFLSAALTQTWSKFSTILLDDPVTHFDDLNAYSFIDLLRSIILSEESTRGHQFIISTCVDKLYHLLRQKLNIVSDRVKFFVFESIGEKGPIWKEVV